MLRRILTSRPKSTHYWLFSTQISPMSSRLPPVPKENERIPTAAEVSATGGVWSSTSAKKDKIVELRGAIRGVQKTLDDAATKYEALDLFLADGIIEVVKTAECNENLIEKKVLQNFIKWLSSLKKVDRSEHITQAQYVSFLAEAISKIDTILSNFPQEQYLKLVGDFMAAPTNRNNFGIFQEEAEEDESMKAFQGCMFQYRLHLIRAAAEHMKEHWDKLITITDGDMDRAAVKRESLEQTNISLPLNDVISVLLEYASGDSSTQVDAMWNLIDRDKDGLLDESEMTQVADFVTISTGKGLSRFFEEVLRARPAWKLLKHKEKREENFPKSFWGNWTRRKETVATKRLKKQFTRAVMLHFEYELEMRHRLRCIYAWANKAHQKNRIDSVHIDTGFGGRKRYVELVPKISLLEFREVQQEHFAHLDRVSEEIIRSFREDLWVYQGSGRESTELWKNIFYFLTAISIIDTAIYIL